MVYPIFYPVNEKFVKEQGTKFGLEANTTLYNGPFTLSDWQHERSFKMTKSASYWDNKEVKIEEVNFNIVKIHLRQLTYMKQMQLIERRY